uniref:30S ribosomal protein S20 n=1 Tax=Paenibacillus xylanexedens TaxID=528191 RepID=UPI001C92D07C
AVKPPHPPLVTNQLHTPKPPIQPPSKNLDNPLTKALVHKNPPPPKNSPFPKKLNPLSPQP